MAYLQNNFSLCLIVAEGGCPDTTFIEDAVHVLLKTRRILKCSYPYGFFLEPKSTKKEIFELMQVRYPFKIKFKYSYYEKQIFFFFNHLSLSYLGMISKQFRFHF